MVLNATDLGICPVEFCYIDYRLRNTRGWWFPWKSGELNTDVELLLYMNIDVIEFYAVDVLGNTEPVHHYELPTPG